MQDDCVGWTGARTASVGPDAATTYTRAEMAMVDDDDDEEEEVEEEEEEVEKSRTRIFDSLEPSDSYTLRDKTGRCPPTTDGGGKNIRNNNNNNRRPLS